jgi:cysteine synthase A
MMRAMGAEVILVPQAPGSTPGQVSGDDLALLEDKVLQLVAERGAFRLDQFHHPGNIRAHELHTGPEIWDACQGTLTAFCDFAGTGGTFAGLARAFRARNPAVKGYLVEPQTAAALAGHKVTCPAHRIQGGGYAMAPLPLLAGVAVDGYITVSDDEAMTAGRRLAREEGIFAGFSSGANLAAALKLLAGPQAGGTIAIVICDTGLKYLSTDLW